MDEKMLMKKRYRVIIRNVAYTDIDVFTYNKVEYFDDLMKAIQYGVSQSYKRSDMMQDAVVIDLKEEAMVYFSY